MVQVCKCELKYFKMDYSYTLIAFKRYSRKSKRETLGVLVESLLLSKNMVTKNDFGKKGFI